MTRPAPHWITAERVKMAVTILVSFYPVTLVGWGILAADQVAAGGVPFGSDFITFWAASFLALTGEAAAAFESIRILWAERVAVPDNQRIFLWHYPPTFQLFILPLAFLPYLTAYFLWVLSTLSALAVVLRRFVPSPYTVPLLLTFTGTFLNFFHGQNGFLTAALLGASMLILPKHKIGAGILIGLMSYKPQLGLLIPLALICGRQWTALIWATITTILLALSSWVILGSEVWIAFWKNLPLVQDILIQGRLPWAKIPSVFVALRAIGLEPSYAYAGQGMIAALVALTIAWVWRQTPATPLAAALLMAGAPLVSPYVFDYDLALLAVPIAILAWDGVMRGWHPGDREILVLAFFTPALVSLIYHAVAVQIGPLCLLLLFAMATRRALRAPESAPRHQPLPVIANI
jgi:hypothetical protein